MISVGATLTWVAAWGQNWPPTGWAQAIVLGGETVTLGGDTLLDAALVIR